MEGDNIMKKLLIGTNTKMYKGIAHTISFLEELGELTNDIRHSIELFVIPSFTTLDQAVRVAGKYNIRIGAQNVAWENEGPFTGEVSPVMLSEVGVDIAEIAHSERRQIFGETDSMANSKVQASICNNLTALLCIGETKQEKDGRIADAVLKKQIEEGLNGIKPEDAANIWIAYEPVWAIGEKGEPATSQYAEDRHAYIRQTLESLLGHNIIPILYGGSVNHMNAAKLIREPHIDGLFVGRSAWDAHNFNRIIRDVLPIWQEKTK